MRVIGATMLSLALAACGSGPDDTRSMRQTLADWIAPEGYTPAPGTPPAPVADQLAAQVRDAYAADAARLEAGGRAVAVSQVTVWGGRVNVPTGGPFSGNGWRDAGGVVTVTVAECQTVPMALHRADKAGSTTIYVMRVGGIVYLAPWPGQQCGPPSQAVSLPGSGQFPLSLPARVDGATVRIEPWGLAPTYAVPLR